jgi:hypothetical protein
MTGSLYVTVNFSLECNWKHHTPLRQHVIRKHTGNIPMLHAIYYEKLSLGLITHVKNTYVGVEVELHNS